jgi:aminopeptidase N
MRARNVQETNMPRISSALLILFACTTIAWAADPPVPTGRLPDTIRPTAYRLDLTIDPAKADFSGHTEIEVVLTRATSSFFIHGNELRVSAVRVTAGYSTVSARYTQVDDTGVARVDLPRELPAGKIVLSFDYTAAFRTGAEGLYRSEIGGAWYAWTQMAPIDARRMFPGFDEPGFKTPFNVTVTSPTNVRVFANAPESAAEPSGAMTVHRFATTEPLPTYLIALGVGPFDVAEASIPPNAVRKQPVPLRVIATKGQASRMKLAVSETPKLLAQLEEYFGSAYPYEKLDLIASPLLGGAMENAGLIAFDDTILLLDADAPFSQLRAFGEINAHELAHQWFGDLVTPTWWTDIWLNEAFAEWMGKKIGDRWRPDLGIGASELKDAFGAMESDSLARGRPIRQEITENRQIASVFDAITYRKGAQVLSMFESYLGAEKFAEGIRLHLKRYAHGNASAEEFFASLSEAARDPKVVPAMRTFTDQRGVPVVSVESKGEALALSQARYRPLGVEAEAPQTWIIPLCLASGEKRSCTLLENPSAPAPFSKDAAPLMPNAGGAGYYRFHLDGEGWDRLIAASAGMPGREALAMADSIWADFEAGAVRFDRVVSAARSLSSNKERLAAVELGTRLKDLAEHALEPGQLPAYRKLMLSIYAPRLAALGFDPRAGAHAQETAEKQALRQSLVPLVALEGRDAKLREQLSAAAVATLAGNTRAIDPAFRTVAFSVAVQERGAPLLEQLKEAMMKSNDPLFRSQASTAMGAADTPELAQRALTLAMSEGMQPFDTLGIVYYLSRQPGVRDRVISHVNANFDALKNVLPGFARSQVILFYEGLCRKEDVENVEKWVRPKLASLGGGELELAQTQERIRLCVALKEKKGAEIAAELR